MQQALMDPSAGRSIRKARPEPAVKELVFLWLGIVVATDVTGAEQPRIRKLVDATCVFRLSSDTRVLYIPEQTYRVRGISQAQF